jgi:hypothetical protein
LITCRKTKNRVTLNFEFKVKRYLLYGFFRLVFIRKDYFEFFILPSLKIGYDKNSVLPSIWIGFEWLIFFVDIEFGKEKKNANRQ